MAKTRMHPLVLASPKLWFKGMRKTSKTQRAIALVEKAADLLSEAGEHYPAHTLHDWLTNEAPDVALEV